MYAAGLTCTQCGSQFDLQEMSVTCSACGAPLEVTYDLQRVARSLTPDALSRRACNVWRYRELLPVGRAERIVSLGEGWTPLVRPRATARALGLENLTVKLDYLHPSGSFKDRGSTVLISRVRELGIASVVDDSSGNAGSSIAGYAAASGMGCAIYVPAGVPSGKTLQMRAYGARIVRVEGPRAGVMAAARRASEAEGAYYVWHGANPYFFEGNKTVAYEIAEQMGWSVPDHVVLPVGGGTLFVAVWKGFGELLALGLIDRTPRLHAVQSAACRPVVDAYERGLEEVVPVTEGQTVAGGVRIGDPARGRQVLRAIRSSGGTALAVPDEELLRYQRALAQQDGIFAEPTSCLPLAALPALCASGAIGRADAVVVPLTGFGLKDPEAGLETCARGGVR